MDIVEARRKAKQQKSGAEPAKEALEVKEIKQAEDIVPPKKEPKKAAKVPARKKTAKAAPAAAQKSSPKKAEAARPPAQQPKPAAAKKPKPALKKTKEQEPAKHSKLGPGGEPKKEEEVFVDMNFGEDLPSVGAHEKDFVLEEKKPAQASTPMSKEEAGLMKKVAEELMHEAEHPPAPKPVSAKAPPQPKAAPESEDDFYEMVVEDLVQYGYGQSDAETNLTELLSFRLAGEIYAVPLTRIQQIIKPRPVTLVPGSPQYVLGIISLRGMVIPIFDLRKRLGLPVSDPTRLSRIIIIKLDDDVLAGILVDQVMEVARVPQDSFEATPAVFSDIEGEFIDGIARHKNQMMIVLNLSQVVMGRKENGKAE